MELGLRLLGWKDILKYWGNKMQPKLLEELEQELLRSKIAAIAVHGSKISITLKHGNKWFNIIGELECPVHSI